jgi:hypothetical protein
MICRAFAPETLAPPLERWEASQTSHDTAVGTSQTQVALVQALSEVVEGELRCTIDECCC